MKRGGKRKEKGMNFSIITVTEGSDEKGGNQEGRVFREVSRVNEALRR